MYELSVHLADNAMTGYNPFWVLLIAFISYLLFAAAVWPMFVKAGLPGWPAFVPILNRYLLVKIAGYHGGFTVLLYVPFVAIVMALFVAIGIGRAYRKGAAFSVFLLWLFSLIGYFILGYGPARYIGAGGRPEAE